MVAGNYRMPLVHVGHAMFSDICAPLLLTICNLLWRNREQVARQMFLIFACTV